MTDEPACPFCNPDPKLIFHQSELVLGLWDRYPVSPGHALLIPRYPATRKIPGARCGM